MKTLTKSNLDIAVISKKEERPVLFISKHCTAANDKRILVEVTRPEIDSDTFPVIEGVEPKQEIDIMIPSEDAIKTSKKIPNKRSQINSIKQAIVSQNGNVKIASTDLNSQDVSNIIPLEGKYEDYRQVIPPENNTKTRIAFDPAYMEIICKLAKEFQKQLNADDDYRLIYMDIGEPGTAIKLHTRNYETRQEFTAVLMPMMEPEEQIEARK